MEINHGVAGETQRRQRCRGNLKRQFLGQFADERRLGCFANLDLAAGKLPKPGQRRTLRPPGDQDAAIGVRDCRSDNGDEPDQRAAISFTRVPGTSLVSAVMPFNIVNRATRSSFYAIRAAMVATGSPGATRTTLTWRPRVLAASPGDRRRTDSISGANTGKPSAGAIMMIW